MDSIGNGTTGAMVSIEELLGLLATGATGQILMALEARPLRTKKLTERIPTYSPRTIYRQTRKLTDLGLVERQETAGVPSTVVHSLSDPAGQDLVRLLNSYGRALLPGSPASRGGDGFWTALGLIGSMWGLGWVDQLSQQGRTVTELSAGTGGLTFHQISRRTQQLISWGLLCQEAPGQRKRFQLTKHSRQGMAVVAAIARWREKHLLGVGKRGMSVAGMAVVLRAGLPLIELSAYPGVTIKLGIVDAADQFGSSGSETIAVKTEASGRIRFVKDREEPGAWALSTVGGWLEAILSGDRAGIRNGGDVEIVDSCLAQLHEAFWTPPAAAPTAALV
jgi:DNA-binding HxlR family transcriptional regulator